MSADYFLDSNILVHLSDKVDNEKRKTAEPLVQQALHNETGCISYQVVEESINVITRKLNAPPEKARQLLNLVLTPHWRVNPTQTLYERSLNLQTRNRFSFYDSLIVAAAFEAGCKTLYSEDLRHGQQIDGVTITNPFRT